MLSEKIAELLTINQQIEKCLSSEMQEVTAEMASLVDSLKQGIMEMVQEMGVVSKQYLDEARGDMKEMHREHTSYTRSRGGKNVAKAIYLAVTPALVLLDFLSRYFG